MARDAEREVVSRVLLIEDDEDDALIARELLAEATGSRFEVEWQPRWQDGLERLLRGEHDVCLMDFWLGHTSGIEVMRQAIERGCEVPIVMLTGADDRAVDVAAMQGGAAEFLVKGKIDAQLLERAIRYAIARTNDAKEIRRQAERLEAARDALAQQNERLRELDGQKNAFLGMAAHDLRSPLGVVFGYSQMLVDELETLPPEEARCMLERIRKSSAFMRGLIDDLLDFAAIEAGALHLDPSPVDPGALAAGNAALNQVLASAKSIRIEVDADGQLPLVDLDERRFEQVLNNLIGNAVKYSGNGSTVTVKVRASDGHVVFTVADQGRGMSKEFLSELFSPFTREGATGTAGEKSTGLGLAIVRRIVQAHGGTVTVESEVGRGSAFHVAVPQHRPRPEAEAPAPRSDAA